MWLPKSIRYLLGIIYRINRSITRNFLTIFKKKVMDRNSRLCKINKRLLLIELLDYYLSFEHLLEREKLGSFDLLECSPSYRIQTCLRFHYTTNVQGSFTRTWSYVAIQDTTRLTANLIVWKLVKYAPWQFLRKLHNLDVVEREKFTVVL